MAIVNHNCAIKAQLSRAHFVGMRRSILRLPLPLTFMKIKNQVLLAALSLPCLLFAAPHNSNAASSESSPTAISQSDARLAKLEKLVLNYVNEARRSQGLRALSWNEKLATVARAHSVEMRELNYFAHESPTENLREPLDRYNAVFDDTPHLLAENIFRSWGSRHEISDADAKRAHDSLMKSPGHRANILLKSITQIGIGIEANENGDLWVTQMFIKP